MDEIICWPHRVSTPARFCKDTHAYFDDGGRRLPSVTQCLPSRYGSIPKHVLEAARLRGQAVHDLTAHEDTGVEAVWPDDLLPFGVAWRRFREEFGGRVVLVEQQVVGRGYAGTLDRLIYRPESGSESLNGSESPNSSPWHLVDIKTTSEVGSVDALQTALYAAALNQPVGEPRMRRWTVQLRKDGSYRMREWSDSSDASTALAFVVATNWRLRNGY